MRRKRQQFSMAHATAAWKGGRCSGAGIWMRCLLLFPAQPLTWTRPSVSKSTLRSPPLLGSARLASPVPCAPQHTHGASGAGVSTEATHSRAPMRIGSTAGACMPWQCVQVRPWHACGSCMQEGAGRGVPCPLQPTAYGAYLSLNDSVQYLSSVPVNKCKTKGSVRFGGGKRICFVPAHQLGGGARAGPCDGLGTNCAPLIDAGTQSSPFTAYTRLPSRGATCFSPPAAGPP